MNIGCMKEGINKIKGLRDFSGGPMAKVPHPQYRGAQVQSQVRDLNPHTANKTRCSTPSKKNSRFNMLSPSCAH